MKFLLKLSPVSQSLPFIVPSLEKEGTILKINGESFDFANMSSGDILPKEAIASNYFLRDITLTGDVLEINFKLEYGYIPYPPPNDAMQVLFPQPILVETDGPITLPKYEAQS